MTDSCFNSHALRQLEDAEADAERRAIEVEDTVGWQFVADCIDQPDLIARVIEEWEVDITPALALIFKPLPHADLGLGRVYEIQNAVRQCFHRYLSHQITKGLEE